MLCEVNFKKINKIYKEQFMKDGKSIVLIGMPGVGKSTIGVILAKEIGYSSLSRPSHSGTGRNAVKRYYRNKGT